LLHGFDDSGSRFDAKGRLNMWWTQDDRAKFDARANKLVTQAGEFSPLPDLRLNGRVSLGENIADLGGVQVAYDALQRALETGQRDKIDGFTPEQRFFLSWAQVWRRNFTEAALRVQINVGPHAPGPFRTNGPLSNLPAFAQAFSCKAGDPMVRDPAKRVEIW
jgi:putative endopeptidase